MAAAVVLATRNAHKLREFQRLLPDVALEPLPDEIELPPETGETFEENALIKARAAAEATEPPVDRRRLRDRGRGAGRPPRRALRPLRRRARHRRREPRQAARRGRRPARACATSARSPTSSPATAPRTVEGTCEGRMAEAPRGDGGFGYDPVFVPADGDGTRTMAELSDDEKDRISHRGRAVREAAAWLPSR